jgi:hypothetical protein
MPRMGTRKEWGACLLRTESWKNTGPLFKLATLERGLLSRTDTLEHYRAFLAEMKPGQNAGHLS